MFNIRMVAHVVYLNTDVTVQKSIGCRWPINDTLVVDSKFQVAVSGTNPDKRNWTGPNQSLCRETIGLLYPVTSSETTSAKAWRLTNTRDTHSVPDKDARLVSLLTTLWRDER